MTIIEQCFFMCISFAMLTYVAMTIVVYIDNNLKKSDIIASFGVIFSVCFMAACALSSFACGLVGILILCK